MEEDLSFQYHLKNTKPIELLELTNSLASLDVMFKEQTKVKDAKLYVHTVREGSIIVDLVQYVGVSMLQFPDVAPLFVSFAEYLFLKIREAMVGQPLERWSIDELKSIRSILSPATKGDNSLELSVADNKGNIFNNCSFNLTASQAHDASLNIEAEEIRRKETVLEDEVYEELLVLTQLRNESSAVGSQGVIDRFGSKPKRLLFAPGTNEVISRQSDNPFKQMYFVRFSVKTANGEIKAYYIQSVLDIIPLEG